ncbi:hypothetical protein F4810DRAFT_664212 [Camillea tinctor]|nr:hypothetical protein F4810DRAFT_664212 [Camillea tinctor]
MAYSNTPDIKLLPQGAIAEIPKIAEWLQSKEAEFKIVDDIEICKNSNDLAKVADKFLKKFAKEVTPNPSQNRLTAIYLDQPTIVPIDQGWIVDLIPVHVVEGIVTVEGRQLDKGHYLHMKEEAWVSGDFYAVLLLTELRG